MKKQQPSFQASAELDASKELAWKALSQMNQWLLQLDSVESIRVLGFNNTEASAADADTNSAANKQEFFVDGRRYSIKTSEGVSMKAKISKIDPQKHELIIDAHIGPLRSHLMCSIKDGDNNKSVLLVSVQEYSGLFGKMFAQAKAEREAKEVQDYLAAWKAWTQKLALEESATT